MPERPDLPYSSIENDEELLREIGRVVAVWSMLSSLLAVIPFQNGDFQAHDTFFNSGTEYNRIERAIGFVKRAGSSAYKGDELIDALTRIKTMLTERNTIIHGLSGRTIDRQSRIDLSVVTDPKSDRLRRSPRPFLNFVQNHLKELRPLIGVVFDIVHEPVWEAMKSFNTPKS